MVVIETSFEKLYEGEPLFDGIYQALTNGGYRFHGQIGQLHSPVDGRPLQGDAVFLRNA